MEALRRPRNPAWRRGPSHSASSFSENSISPCVDSIEEEQITNRSPRWKATDPGSFRHLCSASNAAALDLIRKMSTTMTTAYDW